MENIFDLTKLRIISSVNLAVCPVYFTGNIANSTTVHRKPEEKKRTLALIIIIIIIVGLFQQVVSYISNYANNPVPLLLCGCIGPA